MELEPLLAAARTARDFAYAPYSKFRVGAALLATNGRVFSGCNVENLSFGLTMCAERVAVGKALAEGVASFVAIAVVADTDLPVSPCGACRQVMAEFNPDLEIHLFTLGGDHEQHSLRDLFPRASTGILNH